MNNKIIKNIILFFFISVMSVSAQTNGGGEIPIKPNPPGGGHGGPGKSDYTIYVLQDDFVLTFPTIYESCMVCLADEDDDIVFTGYVGTDGTITLPTTLSGNFTLILYVDDIIYYGDIEL